MFKILSHSVLLTSILLLISCSVYKSEFECLPAKGVPCTSVTDIESMIIEAPAGPDIFKGSFHEKIKSPVAFYSLEKQCKKYRTPCGEKNAYISKGYYVYFPDVKANEYGSQKKLTDIPSLQIQGEI